MVFCTLTNSSVTKIDKELFEKLEAQISLVGQSSDKDDFETIKKNLANPPRLSPEDFAFEAIYVILAGGFSQKTAKRVFAEICAYLTEANGAPIRGSDLFEIFKNANKTNATAKIWNGRKEFCEKFYSLKTDGEKLDFLETLPHIGKITKNHIARNLGISVVKYDVWIQRLALALCDEKKPQKNTKSDSKTAKNALDESLKSRCDEIFATLQKETGLPVGYLDAVLWKSCQIGLFSF